MTRRVTLGQLEIGAPVPSFSRPLEPLEHRPPITCVAVDGPDVDGCRCVALSPSLAIAPYGLLLVNRHPQPKIEEQPQTQPASTISERCTTFESFPSGAIFTSLFGGIPHLKKKRRADHRRQFSDDCSGINECQLSVEAGLTPAARSRAACVTRRAAGSSGLSGQPLSECDSEARALTRGIFTYDHLSPKLLRQQVDDFHSQPLGAVGIEVFRHPFAFVAH